MTPVVRRRPLVVADLIEHYAWIESGNPEAAIRFKDQVRRDFQRLAAMPEMGPRHPMTHPLLAGLRFWPIKGFSNYLIFYFPTDDGVEIVRVLHAARDLSRVLAEDPEIE